VWVLAVGLSAYILWAIGYRIYLVKHYAAPRIDSAELHERMKGNSAPIVLDLRRDEYYERGGRMIAGSFRLRPATFHRFAHHLPRDRDLVFYCT
jgi:rhodanese-related sulfurtransferase